MVCIRLAVLVLLGLLACSCTGVPTNLRSDKQRAFQQEELSEQKHFDADGVHDAEYDHQAILGEEAKEFDEFTEEESKRRLG